MSGDPHAGRREAPTDLERLGAIARALRGSLPVFESPLTTFQLGGIPREGDPLYLGGDLNAVHPDAAAHHPRARHDPTLEAATVRLYDQVHPAIETTADHGIWCLPLTEGRADTAPILSILDSTDRLRAWILLPKPRQMIGLGHFWLPAVPPPRR